MLLYDDCSGEALEKSNNGRKEDLSEQFSAKNAALRERASFPTPRKSAKTFLPKDKSLVPSHPPEIRVEFTAVVGLCAAALGINSAVLLIFSP